MNRSILHCVVVVPVVSVLAVLLANAPATAQGQRENPPGNPPGNLVARVQALETNVASLQPTQAAQQPDQAPLQSAVTALQAEQASLQDDAATLLADVAALLASAMPPGTIVAYAGDTPPADGSWLLCDGSEVSRTIYASLFAAIGTSHGDGDGSTTFNLPDYRGRFLRGVDHGSGRDPGAGSRTAMQSGGNAGDMAGSVQATATAQPTSSPFVTSNAGVHVHGLGGTHTHTIPSVLAVQGTTFGDGNGSPRWASYNGSVVTGSAGTHLHPPAGDHSHSITGGDVETRPINASVNWIIKFH